MGDRPVNMIDASRIAEKSDKVVVKTHDEEARMRNIQDPSKTYHQAPNEKKKDINSRRTKPRQP